MVRRIIIYGNKFLDFYHLQDKKVQQKIEYVLDLVRFEQHVPRKFFKLLMGTNGIYEIKVITAFMSVRILCFFDSGDLLLLTNCFIKKSQKTPIKEIQLAERLRKEYLYQK